MKIDKPTPVDVLRKDYAKLRDEWLIPGGFGHEFDAHVKELADWRHGQKATHRPVDLVAAARFIALSRTDPGYRRWFQEWKKTKEVA